MQWINQTLQWYTMLFILGLCFIPFSHILFSKFQDKGYAFAKPLGIIITTYILFVITRLHILPFSEITLFIILGICVALNAFVLIKKRKEFARYPLKTILFEELLFILALFFWAYVRGQEPSIRGLEKFMDFGFINTILRSTYMPPVDMWLSGQPINYYYFGHLSAAVLTKLSFLNSSITYNLILATLFALGITESFSTIYSMLYHAGKKIKSALIGGIIGTFLVNLAGNLHTIYTFTKGYPNEKPIPFWEILSKFNPTSYWYPNATRFIPYTIHEFPIYSYVVADLHGHVFDIPFVILTLALVFSLYFMKKNTLSPAFFSKDNLTSIATTLLFGLLIAIHYMTNAFDGPIYGLLMIGVFFVVYKLSIPFIFHSILLGVGFILFSLPFSSHFIPFASGIGVNCAPEMLTKLGKLGPFLFEKGNCQISPWWMLMLLWGFFIFNFIFFVLHQYNRKSKDDHNSQTNNYILVLFSLGTFLLIVPEFFYIKDIYPAHFRANTMFKLGYQAFIMMSIASAYTLLLIKKPIAEYIKNKVTIVYTLLALPLLFLVILYPYFAIKSYYGLLQKTPQLNGVSWIDTQYPEYAEIIYYLNKLQGQPTILEAQGDSYTDFDVVSSYTGLPTVGGWYVHQWLWRGKPEVLGNRVPDIEEIYKGEDVQKTKAALRKYNIEYIIVGPNEEQKYTTINIEKLEKITKLILLTENKRARLYKVTQKL